MAREKTANAGRAIAPQRRLSPTHLRMLRIMSERNDWISLTALCREAGIANRNVGRVYLSHIRAVLKDRIELATERSSDGRALYLLQWIDEGILPRCPHCRALL